MNKFTVIFALQKGGTICSIEDFQGIEYLWQGDATYWSGQAPILFPICGGLRDDKALIGDAGSGNTDAKTWDRKKT